MIITINNFGPISRMEIDVSKDLHLVYGTNSIGKSYAAYCVYCILKNVKNKRFREYIQDYNSVYSKFEDSVDKILKRTNKKIGEKVVVSSSIMLMMNDIISVALIDGLKNSFLNSFSSLSNLKNRYTNQFYSIDFVFPDKGGFMIVADKEGAPVFKMNKFGKLLSVLEKNTKTTKYSLYWGDDRLFASPNKEEFMRQLYNMIMFNINAYLDLLDFNIRDVYYLPASRSGLYQALSSFTPIMAELTQNRFFLNNRSFQLPALSEPLSDYFLDLSTLNKANLNKNFLALIEELEKNILKGEVIYSEDTRKITYKPYAIDIELDISESSSMVAEISPIVLYLKHIVNNKFQSTKTKDSKFYDPYYSVGKKKGWSDIMFIEEPEAHLHPDVQVKLIDIFSKLSKMGVKIFITSHSNYMFYEVNNLILKKEMDYRKVAAYHLVASPAGSIVNKDMYVDADGINDENFQNTTRRLYEERENID